MLDKAKKEYLLACLNAAENEREYVAAMTLEELLFFVRKKKENGHPITRELYDELIGKIKGHDNWFILVTKDHLMPFMIEHRGFLFTDEKIAAAAMRVYEATGETTRMVNVAELGENAFDRLSRFGAETASINKGDEAAVVLRVNELSGNGPWENVEINYAVAQMSKAVSVKDSESINFYYRELQRLFATTEIYFCKNDQNDIFTSVVNYEDGSQEECACLFTDRTEFIHHHGMQEIAMAKAYLKDIMEQHPELNTYVLNPSNNIVLIRPDMGYV